MSVARYNNVRQTGVGMYMYCHFLPLNLLYAKKRGGYPNESYKYWCQVSRQSCLSKIELRIKKGWIPK